MNRDNTTEVEKSNTARYKKNKSQFDKRYFIQVFYTNAISDKEIIIYCVNFMLNGTINLTLKLRPIL